MTTIAPAAPPSPTSTTNDKGPTFPRLMLSEWTKLRSLRSTWWTLGIAVLIGLGLATAIAFSLTVSDSPDAGVDTVNVVLAGTGFAALVGGVLGALQMSGEYTSGTISTTVTAVPRRWPVLAAKAAVLVAVVAPLALAMSAGALLIADAVIDGGVALSWAAVLGNTLYLTAVALFGLGVATMVRGTAVAITVLVAVVFVVPPLLPLLPWNWVATAADYFPGTAGLSLTNTVADVAMLGDATAIATLAAWALVPLAAGAVLLTRRDA